MEGQDSREDAIYLARAIELSENSLANGGTPFGAVLVADDAVLGEGSSQVVTLMDPTAHAEVMALRDAGKRNRRHLFEDATMYASSEPCPMCLVACYWARVPRLVFGATSTDVAWNGFEDLQLYRELAAPASERSLGQGTRNPELLERARAVLRAWTDSLPEPVVPKL
ncbi:nucleoside deaminase [Streptomyces sp. 7G]|uniref:nucleoside deaminase n=1 Tax=Streptomyces sp. 7G TaxID=2877241 RepID=UPI001CD36553|nr:nucleoside deaminase [Streptomyces sp. 7G]